MELIIIIIAGLLVYFIFNSIHTKKQQKLQKKDVKAMLLRLFNLLKLFCCDDFFFIVRTASLANSVWHH